MYEEAIAAVPHARWALQTDITSFFASTDSDVLVEDIKARAGRTAATDALEQVLDAHRLLAERRGLPQRCYASSYLANLAVSAVDDTIAAALSEKRISSARRWMDDISVESDRRENLYKLIVDIQGSMRRAGLEINTAKTVLTDGKSSHALLKTDAPEQIQLRHLIMFNEYGEDGLQEPQLDLGPLARAEERLLADPKRISRGEGSMVLKALRKYEKTDRYLEWRDIAPQLPHIADTLGRYFALAIRKNRGAKRALEGWFVNFVESEWASVEWVPAQYAMAFSSDNLPRKIVPVMQNWLKHSRNLQHVSLAAQRLAQSDAPYARTVISNRSSSETDPHLIRALGAGLVASGGGQADVRKLLCRSGHHRVTLKALDARKWKLPSVSDDFDPVAK